MRYLAISIFLVLTSVLVFRIGIAQENEIDSLNQVLKNAPNDSEKLEALLKLARPTRYSDREKSIDLYMQAAELINDQYEKAAIIDTLGLLNWQSGKYEEALVLFHSALKDFAQLKDSSWLGKINNNIAVVNWGLGNSNEAIKFYQNGLSIRRAINDHKGVSRILNNMGIVYQDWGLFDEALELHHEALEIAQDIEDNDVISYSYSNIGICLKALNKLEDALKYYQLGYKALAHEDKYNRSESFFLGHIGNVYLQMNQLDSALINHQRSFEYATKIGNEFRIATANYNLGMTYLALNRINAAKIHFTQSNKISIQNKYNSLIRDNLFVLSKIEEKRGNSSRALKLFKDASAMKDSIFNKEKIAKFTDLQIKYNTAQHVQENTILKKNNEIQEITIRGQRKTGKVLIISGLIILAVLISIARSQISYKKLSQRLNKSEQELRKANADKDRFFTIIAHDLKGPFNGILGFLDILKIGHQEMDENKRQTIIDNVDQSAHAAYKLLDNLLIWSRVETGKMPYSPQLLNLSEVAQDTLSLNQLLADSKNITLENIIEENHWVAADRNMLKTIFRNLISNAIKFTNSGGSITIAAKNSDQLITISVTDTGIGMKGEDLKDLFNLSENNTVQGTNNEIGTGLGLVLCKQFIDKHEGNIWVESRPNIGSSFYFTLPLSVEEQT